MDAEFAVDYCIGSKCFFPFIPYHYNTLRYLAQKLHLSETYVQQGKGTKWQYVDFSQEIGTIINFYMED